MAINTEAIENFLYLNPLVLVIHGNEDQGVLVRVRSPAGSREVFRVHGASLAEALQRLGDACEARNANEQEPR